MVLNEVNTVGGIGAEISSVNINVTKLVNDILTANHGTRTGDNKPVLSNPQVDEAAKAIKVEVDKLVEHATNLNTSAMNIKEAAGPILTWCNIGPITPTFRDVYPDWEPDTDYPLHVRITPSMNNEGGNSYQSDEAGKSGHNPPFFTQFVGDRTMDSNYHNDPERKQPMTQTPVDFNQEAYDREHEHYTRNQDARKESFKDKFVDEVERVKDKFKGKDKDSKSEDTKDKE